MSKGWFGEKRRHSMARRGISTKYRAGGAKSPLEWKRKQSAKNTVYKLVDDLTKGFFRDDDWSNIRAIEQRLRENDIQMYLLDSCYYRDREGNIAGKKWKYEIPFVNNRGNFDKLYGTITASFAGPVDDISEVYDITFTL